MLVFAGGCCNLGPTVDSVRSVAMARIITSNEVIGNTRCESDAGAHMGGDTRELRLAIDLGSRALRVNERSLLRSASPLRGLWSSSSMPDHFYHTRHMSNPISTDELRPYSRRDAFLCGYTASTKPEQCLFHSSYSYYRIVLNPQKD